MDTISKMMETAPAGTLLPQPFSLEGEGTLVKALDAMRGGPQRAAPSRVMPLRPLR